MLYCKNTPHDREEGDYLEGYMGGFYSRRLKIRWRDPTCLSLDYDHMTLDVLCLNHTFICEKNSEFGHILYDVVHVRYTPCSDT